MLRYRTKIVVSPDRYVCLQLPEQFPEGPATVTVLFNDPSLEEPEGPADENDPDREDIEWWEEFDGETRQGG